MSGARVLLVEDDAEARGSLARALERAGYTVVAADAPEAAFAALRQAPSVDAAVVDVVLGDDDRGGLRVLQHLRASAIAAPVVVVTAFADVAKVKDALNFGASHLLEKPFRAAELLDVLGQLLTAREGPAEIAQRAFAAAGLTARETEVALLALKGLSSPEIGQVLQMSEKTARQHLGKVYEKLGVRGRGELAHLLFPV